MKKTTADSTAADMVKRSKNGEGELTFTPMKKAALPMKTAASPKGQFGLPKTVQSGKKR